MIIVESKTTRHTKESHLKNIESHNNCKLQFILTIYILSKNEFKTIYFFSPPTEKTLTNFMKKNSMWSVFAIRAHLYSLLKKIKTKLTQIFT